uniref:Exocyst complex component 6 (Trinotate prediction) n=1 Tax=Henneguya salminicola TaxID=69463 RepID=A0A6G3ME42_HENSL
MTLEFLHKCLPAININKMFDKPIKPENYLELLDACDKLESMNDLTVIQIPIIKRIFDSIPRIRTSIKIDAIENLKNFLNISLEQFPLIGVKYWAKALISLNINIDVSTKQRFESIENAPLFSSLSFSSVYWYSHILEALPCEEIDHKFYMNQRKEQLLLIFNYNVKHDASKPFGLKFEEMLYGVVGFFVVEHFILHSVNNFISQCVFMLIF